MTKLELYLEKLQATQTPDELQTLVENVGEIYGVANTVYHALNLNGSPYAALTYTQQWTDHYLDQNYIRVDPVVKAALQRFAPIDWNRLDWSSKGSQAFMDDAISAGVGNQGLSIPIRAQKGQFALFTINQEGSLSDWEKFIKENIRDFQLISHYIHQKANELTATEDENPAKLSPREVSALAYLANGLTRSEAAFKMNISEHTLRVYLDTARHKLGAVNLIHAVMLAMRNSMILL